MTKLALFLRASYNMLPQLPGKAQEAALDPFFGELDSWKFGNGFGGEALPVVEQENQLVPVGFRDPLDQIFDLPQKNSVFHGIFLSYGLQGGIEFGFAQQLRPTLGGVPDLEIVHGDVVSDGLEKTVNCILKAVLEFTQASKMVRTEL